MLAAQVKAQARAAKLAAQQAAAAQRANLAWVSHGRPKKLVIVRTTSVDSVSEGVLVQRVLRDGHAVSSTALDAAIPSSWMTIDGDTARLSASVVLSPRTALDIQGIKTLQLVGGPSPTDAVVLYTGSGRIQLRGVTVTSLDPSSGRAVAPDAAGRPYIIVAVQGRLDASDSTISDLGTKQAGDSRGHPAVSFGRDSTGTLHATSLLRNSTGLMLAGSQGVQLEDVTADDSTENGIVLRGDRATALSGVRVERNGANGLAVSGSSTSRPITGISTAGNHSYGVSIVGQSAVEVSNLILAGDQAGGLDLNRDSNGNVRNLTTTDEPNGVFLHGNSVNMVLDASRLTGGRTGILAEKTTKGLRVIGSTIDSAHVVGMAIGGHHTLLDRLTMQDDRTALRVERGAGDVTMNAVSLIGGTDGLVTSGGTSGVVVKNLSADGLGNSAVRSLSPGMQVTGGQISGGGTGLDLQAATSVIGTQIGLTAVGVRARTSGPILLEDVKVDAVSVGVEAPPGSAVTLSSSSVHALEAVRGTVVLQGVDDLSLPPLNLLGAIGLPLVMLALVLEILHVLRQRGLGPSRGRTAPPSVALGTG